MTERYIKLKAIQEFEQAQLRADWHRFWAKLWRRDNQLIPFTEIERWLPHQRQYRGRQDIALSNIVGTLNRQGTFDRHFRPLNMHLLPRWINVRLLADTVGWSPIEVYQVDSLYFVVDGHHRLSVAHHLKYTVIEAIVWEYPLALCLCLNGTVSLPGLINALKPQVSTCIIDCSAEPTLISGSDICP